jgi:hypothetical protein
VLAATSVSVAAESTVTDPKVEHPMSTTSRSEAVRFVRALMFSSSVRVVVESLDLPSVVIGEVLICCQEVVHVHARRLEGIVI